MSSAAAADGLLLEVPEWDTTTIEMDVDESTHNKRKKSAKLSKKSTKKASSSPPSRRSADASSSAMATNEADAGLARPAAKKPKRIIQLPAAPAPIAVAPVAAPAAASAEEGGAKRLSRRARQRQKHRARLSLGEAGAPANANAPAARAPAAPQQKTPKGGIANADAAEATPKQKRAKRKAKRRAEAEAEAEAATAEAMDGGASERPPRARISHSPEVPSLSQLTLAGDSPSHSPRRPLSPVSEDVARVERKEKGSKKSAAMRLQGAKFRMLNEKLYTTRGEEAFRWFSTAPKLFQAYHEGFSLQVEKWPVNPLNNMISYVQRRGADAVIADFGCGEARLAASVPNTVHSFDLVACNDRVTACDMARVPLDGNCIDVAVYCLALMGTNFVDFLLEGHRVLKIGGILKIAEVKSRLSSVDDFISLVETIGFEFNTKNDRNTHFIELEFVKRRKKARRPGPEAEELLQPCIYKRR